MGDERPATTGRRASVNQHQQMPGGCDPDQHTMLPLDSIICGDNVQVLRAFPSECIDLTVTSPPYDNLRKYGGHAWDFADVAQELWRVTKAGGVVVWVVSDETRDGTESGTSFEQALHFKSIGFNLYDTMIFEKLGLTKGHRRYEQEFEYMFVFSKGIPATFNPILADVKWSDNRTTHTHRHTGASTNALHSQAGQRTRIRGNIWRYAVGWQCSTCDREAFKHPAIFPEKLAEDHILSWSNPGDVVLDPFSGSGTTPKMALKNGRHYIGIDVSEEYCGIARRRLQNVQRTLGA